jgi:hypothetical protein
MKKELMGGLSDRLDAASDTAWQYADGGFVLPDRPGIGVEINESLLDPFIVKPCLFVAIWVISGVNAEAIVRNSRIELFKNRSHFG